MDIIRDSDIAMYRAKKQGGGNYQIFDPQMQAEAIALEMMNSTFLPSIR